MKSQFRTIFGAVVLSLLGIAFLGAGSLLLLEDLLARRLPSDENAFTLFVYGAPAILGAAFFWRRILVRWKYTRGGLKASRIYTVQVNYPTVCTLAPIRGVGQGLVQLVITKHRGSGSITPPALIQVRGLTEFDVPSDARHILINNIPQSFHYRHVTELPILRTEPWDFVIEITWDLPNHAASQQSTNATMGVELSLAVAGECTSVSIPAEPMFTATPVMPVRGAFEVIMPTEPSDVDRQQ